MNKLFLLAPVFLLLLITPNVKAFVTGISYTDIVIQNDDKFGDGGKMWVISWSAAGTDSVEGYINSQDLQNTARQNVGSGAEVKQNFNVKMSSGDEYTLYSFISRGDLTPVYKYDLVKGEWSNYLGDSNKVDSDRDTWVNNNCADLNGDGREEYSSWSYDYLLVHTRKVWCAKIAETVATPKGISKFKDVFTTSWEFWADSELKATQTLSNDANSGVGVTTRLSDNVLIKWNGNLNTGYNSPSPIGVIGMHSNNFGGWRIVDEGSYTVYNTYIRNNLANCVYDWADGKNTDTYCENEINYRADTAVKQSTNQDFFKPADLESTTAVITNNAIDGGQFKLNLKERVNIASFVLYIDADYLRINIPVGVPEITQVTSPKFIEGVGYIYASVKNSGNGRGSFEAAPFGCTPSENFRIDSSPMYFELEPQGTKELEFRITGAATTSDKNVVGSCNVYMKETTSQKRIEKAVTVSFDQLNECTPNQWTKCTAGDYCGITRSTSTTDEIYQCKSDGMGWALKTRCASDETAQVQQDGSYACKKVGSCIAENGNCGGLLDKACCSGLTCTSGKCTGGGGGGGCTYNSQCDDGNACTTNVCSAGVCVNDPITTGSCGGGGGGDVNWIKIVGVIGGLALIGGGIYYYMRRK